MRKIKKNVKTVCGKNIRIKTLKATVANKKEFAHLLFQVFDRIPQARIRRNINKCGPGSRIYAAVRGKQFISGLFVRPVKISDVAFGGIGGVATVKTERKNGLGSKLLKKAVEENRRKYKMLLLWTRIPAYFRKAGFSDASKYFKKDTMGSKPMVIYNGNEKEQAVLSAKKLPRFYF